MSRQRKEPKRRRPRRFLRTTPSRKVTRRSTRPPLYQPPSTPRQGTRRSTHAPPKRYISRFISNVVYPINRRRYRNSRVSHDDEKPKPPDDLTEPREIYERWGSMYATEVPQVGGETFVMKITELTFVLRNCLECTDCACISCMKIVPDSGDLTLTCGACRSDLIALRSRMNAVGVCGPK